MQKAIGYIRVSTQGQADEGVSLAAQRAKIAAWCNLNDTELVVLFGRGVLHQARLTDPADLEGLSGTLRDYQGRSLRLPCAAGSTARSSQAVSQTARATARRLCRASKVEAKCSAASAFRSRLSLSRPKHRSPALVPPKIHQRR